MLLWLQPPNTVFLRKLTPDGTASVVYDEDEKGAKIRRRAARAQLMHVILCFGVLISMISLFTMRYQHLSPKIRGIRNRNVKNESNITTGKISSLPHQSIYRLSVKDASGVMQSLQRYAGMVTLIVNTACK